MLATANLLTLTGPGGCGKTRLALEAAHEVIGNSEQRAARLPIPARSPPAEETEGGFTLVPRPSSYSHPYPDGVCFVELAALSDSSFVPQSVMSALGLREQPARSPVQTLISFLASRRVLLLLDNCEHLIDACAKLVETLMRTCPGLSVLATSREPLGILGETIWTVPSLSLPLPWETLTVDRLLRSEAVQLFAQRCQEIQPDFCVAEQNMAAVAQICRRLDGIPLALELAAPRVKLLSVEQLAARLDDRFRLLVGGSRTALPRQQTLRATVDWSYALLSEAEQLLFNRLAVFTGSFELEAAEQIAGSLSWVIGTQVPDILDPLTHLAEKSLVLVERQSGATRFRLLETLRQYGWERLQEQDETDAIQQRHAEYYLALAEAAEPQLTGPEQKAWLERFGQEHDNLRAALVWMEGRPDLRLRLVAAIWRFWYVRGHLVEGRSWLDRALAPSSNMDPQARARALFAAAGLAWAQSDHQQAIAFGLESQRLCRDLGDKRGVAHAFDVLGLVAEDRGEWGASAAYYNEGLALYRELGDAWGIALLLNNLGVVALDQADYARATGLFEESFTLRRQLEDKQGMAFTLHQLGRAAQVQDQHARAQVLQEESLALFRDLDDRRGIAMALKGLGDVAQSQGARARARELYEESLPLWRKVGNQRGIAECLFALGSLSGDEGDHERAAGLHRESLALRRDLGDKLGIIESIESLARVSMLRARPESSARLAAAAESLREVLSAPLPPASRAHHDQTVGALHSMLGETAFAAAWAAGRAMSLEQAVDVALIELSGQDNPPKGSAILSAPELNALQEGVPGQAGSGPFVGRQRELGLLRRDLEHALAGSGRLVLLAGEPGIGKTRLAGELAREADARGAAVLWGNCYEGEGAPAYWPWVQALRAHIQHAEPERLRSEIGSGMRVIAQILPEAREQLPDLPSFLPEPALEPAEARFRLFDSIAALFARAATRRPLVLILEDMHWADQSSLLLLEFLARQLQAIPLLVVVSYRDVELSPQDPLTSTLGKLVREPVSERIELGGLSEPDIARLIELSTGVAPPERLVSAVAQESEGNPFFIGQIARLFLAEGQLEGAAAPAAWRATVPDSVREVIRRRLAKVSQGCSQMLRVAAVIGREFDLTTLSAVSELAGDALLVALDEATQARIITQASDLAWRYRFIHALIRETLYEDLGSPARIRLHAKTGEALEERFRFDLDPHLAEIAYHFAQAAAGGEVVRAVDYAVQAAARALHLLAYEEAVRFYRMGLASLELQTSPDEIRRCDLLLAIGEALRRAGDLPASQASFLQAAPAARILAKPELLARAALGYAEYPDSSGSDRQVRLLAEALQALPEADSALRVHLLGSTAENLMPLGRDRESLSLSAAAVAMARRLGDADALAYALNQQLRTQFGQVDASAQLTMAQDLVTVATTAEDQEMAQSGRRWQIQALLQLGAIAEADAAIAAYSDAAEELHQPFGHLHAMQLRAMRALWAGQLAEGERLARAALDLGQQERSLRTSPGFLTQIVVTRWQQGRLEELEGEIREIAQQQPVEPFWRCALALLYSEHGREAEARAEVERLSRNAFAGLRRGGQWLMSVGMLAQTCALLQDAEAAEALIGLLPYAGENIVSAGAVISTGSAAHYLGLLAATLGRPEDAAGYFEAALAMNRATGAGPFLARTQYHYAALLLGSAKEPERAAAQERSSQAAALLNEALSTARGAGMTRLAEQIADLISQHSPLGERGKTEHSAEAAAQVSSTAGAQSSALTVRELEVLRWIVAGRSNREIAAILVLSVRTIDHHIANIYRKLDVRGRAEATAYALSQNIVTLESPPASSSDAGR